MVASFTYNSYIVAEITLEPTSVYGAGGPEFPLLHIHSKLALLPYGASKDIPQDFLFLTIKSDLYVGERHGKIASSFQPILHRLTEHRYETSYVLEFQLDNYRIERIESSRKRDLELKLEVNIGVGTFGPVLFGSQANNPGHRVSDLCSIHKTIQFTVPQSVWVEKVLPGLGYGLVQLFELPAVSLEHVASLQHSYTALQRACDRFKGGDYDEAVAFCRTAIEPIRNELKEI